MSHRRRGVGVGRNRKTSLAASSKSTTLAASSVAHARSTVEQLQGHLKKFAEDHAQDIEDDPAFRAKFLKVRRGFSLFAVFLIG